MRGLMAGLITMSGAAYPLAVHSITVSSDQGEHTLRALALTDGWNGTDDLDLTVEYDTVDQVGTTVATPLLQTDTISNTGGQSTIQVTITSVDFHGRGGAGGTGGDGDVSTPFNGDPGQDGQKCIMINTGDTSIPVTITNNGTFASGGGGGGGGGGGSAANRGGGGGGGGAKSGTLGSSGTSGNDGSTGGDTTGGSGGAADIDSGAGGAGGNRGVDGTAGDAGASPSTGGAKGDEGTALDKNGHTVTVNGAGSSFGSTVS